MSAAPKLWYLLLSDLFATGDPALADELWRHLPNSGPVAWELGLIESRAGHSLQGVVERTRRLTAVLTPEAMFRASLALAPERQLRSPEIVRFEQAVLNMTTAEGGWKW